MASPRPSELPRPWARAVIFTLAAVASTGCQAFFMPLSEQPIAPPAPVNADGVPNEMSKVSLPTYRIEPPDQLRVEAVKVVPKPPYELDTFDIVRIAGESEALEPTAPLQTEFSIDQEGNVDLGPAYGKVTIVGETIEEASETIREHLLRLGYDTAVSVSLLRIAGQQAITGDLMVGLDGTINLGKYGSVSVEGKTEEEAARAIEAALSDTLQDPEVSVTVTQFNSQSIYVVIDGAGRGDTVRTLPVTGNETVLDAISNVGGLSQVSSQKIAVVRPTLGGDHAPQILPVDWDGIVKRGDPATNWQLMPNDRLFIAPDISSLAFNQIDRTLAPVDRAFGFLGLGTNALQAIRRFGLLR